MMSHDAPARRSVYSRRHGTAIRLIADLDDGLDLSGASDCCRVSGDVDLHSGKRQLVRAQVTELSRKSRFVRYGANRATAAASSAL